MDQTTIKPRSVGAFRFIWKVLLWIGVGLIVLGVVAFLGVGAIAASQLTLPKRVFDPALNPGVYNLAYQDLRISARTDGLPIAAWYIPSEQNQRAIILVHGRDNSRTNGFGNLFVPFANELHKAGFSVMMIDLRGHGQSGDSRYTFGMKERLDILGAVDWLRTQGYQPGTIGVLGYSLGAASVVGAASEEQSIGAIWIDSAYTDIKSILERNWTSESGLPQPFLTSAAWMVRLLYGYDITASRPIDEIGKIAPRPIFIAHCQQDNTIPISHMERLLTVAQNTQKWVIANCDQNSIGKILGPEKYNNHAIGYIIQPEIYGQNVINFFSENLH